MATSTPQWPIEESVDATGEKYILRLYVAGMTSRSTRAVENVRAFCEKHLEGRYDLQVLKKGGTTVTTNEAYALAFTFFSQSLIITEPGTNVTLAWPVYPAGFAVESTTDLSASVWSMNNLPSSTVMNNQNYLLLNATNAAQFFRLRRPNF